MVAESLAVIFVFVFIFGFMGGALYLEHRKTKAFEQKEKTQTALYNRLIQLLEEENNSDV